MMPIPEATPEKPKRQMKVQFYQHDTVVVHFDIKQMICHLLGIATMFLQPLDKGATKWLEPSQILFLYLLYDPSTLPLSGDKRMAVMDIYCDTCKIAKGYPFREMFAEVVEYLVSLRKEHNKPVPGAAYLERLKAAFDFELCSQNDFHTYF
jgi:hypothetical protein